MDPTEAEQYFTPDECESLPEIWYVEITEPLSDAADQHSCQADCS